MILISINSISLFTINIFKKLLHNSKKIITHIDQACSKKINISIMHKLIDKLHWTAYKVIKV